MRALIHAVSRSRLMRTAFFGGMGVIVQTIIFELIGPFGHILAPSLATVVGAEGGILTSFTLNNRFSFGDRSHGSLLKRLLRFHIVVSGSVCIQWFSVFLAETLTTSLLWLHAAYIVGIFLGFLSNYIWYNLWVWRHPHETHESPV